MQSKRYRPDEANYGNIFHTLDISHWEWNTITHKVYDAKIFHEKKSDIHGAKSK